MFAEVVAIEECLRDAFAFRIERCGVKGHARYGLEYNGIVSRVLCVFSPAEGSVSGDEHSGHGIRIEIAEAADDGQASVVHIISMDVVWGKLFRYGHRAVEVVRMRGPISGNAAPSLRPCGRVLGVGMDDCSDGWEFTIEKQMRREIG